MTKFITVLSSVSVLALSGCAMLATDSGEREAVTVEAPPPVEKVVEVVEETVVVEEVVAPTNAELLQAALDAQPDEVKARYDARHPAETLAFFGIEPGMSVAEALPGGGWYTKILMPYLGSAGAIAGAQYPDEMWAKIMPNPTPERIAERIERVAGWQDTAQEWAGEGGPSVKSYQMTTLADDVSEKADAVLFIRALHNMNRADEDRATLNAALAETYRILKPGGIVGVVQHRAPESNLDEWATGSFGYLKQSQVIASFEAAGFVLDGTSEINANAADIPGEGDYVWRLPPTRAIAEEGTPERAALDAIGESDRMTLKFSKPEATPLEDMASDAMDAVEEAVEDAVEAVTDGT